MYKHNENQRKGDNMKIQTVNVIEYKGDDLVSIRSYSEDDEGNKQAEEMFRNMIIEADPEMTEEEIEACTEEGYHEQGEYQLFLSHSE
jgi:hypothetical protein